MTISRAVGNGLLLLLPLEDDAAKVDRALDRAAPAVMRLLLLDEESWNYRSLRRLPARPPPSHSETPSSFSA